MLCQRLTSHRLHALTLVCIYMHVDLFYLTVYGLSYCSVPLVLIYFYLSFGQLSDGCSFKPWDLSRSLINKGSIRGFIGCRRVAKAERAACPLGANATSTGLPLCWYILYCLCVRFEAAKATTWCIQHMDHKVPDSWWCDQRSDRQLSHSSKRFVAFFLFSFLPFLKKSWMP